MGEWFEAGYFKKDLLIRRTMDQEFLTLGQVEQRYGGVNPFRSARHPPAFLTPPPAQPSISRPPGMGPPEPPQVCIFNFSFFNVFVDKIEKK